MPAAANESNNHGFAYHILRYSSQLIRDEWVNIGVLLFDPVNGELRLRLVEGHDEFSRIRRLQPRADEEAIRQLRDHLEDRFQNYLNSQRRERDSPMTAGEALSEIIEKWNLSLSNGIQLAAQKGTYADDLDSELERLYAEQVAPHPPDKRPTGSRAAMRSYCGQVFRQARIWEKIQKSIRLDEFTFPGDPMRIDYGYRHNGTRGFVQTLSVSRSPKDCKELAYSADRIAKKAPFKSEFTAVTDVALQADNLRHRFVSSTLRDAGIEAIPLEGFAVWVAKLRPLLR